MIKFYYLYDSHTDGAYYTDEYFIPKRCELCRDMDFLIGEFTTPKQLRRLLERRSFADWYVDELVGEFEKEWMNELTQEVENG